VAGPIDLALKFLNKISFNCGGADCTGEALDETEAAGEVSGAALGDDDAMVSGTPGVDGRVPAKVADGACALAITTQATLAEIRRIVFIKVAPSSKPTRCRLASALSCAAFQKPVVILEMAVGYWLSHSHI